MQIVIDIDENVFTRLFDNGTDEIVNDDLFAIAKSIHNCTPLPKVHGRLGDLGKIYVELNEAQIEGTEEYKGLGKAKQIVCDAETVIETDKAESEE